LIANIAEVLRPGFEPGSTAREAVILNRTILPELGLVYFSYSNAFAIYSHFVFFALRVGGDAAANQGLPVLEQNRLGMITRHNQNNSKTSSQSALLYARVQA
jgi:hypothetical protein